MTDTSPAVVILAAGKSTRMNSAQPKVLHHLSGQPLLSHVIDTVTRKSAAEGRKRRKPGLLSDYFQIAKNARHLWFSKMFRIPPFWF